MSEETITSVSNPRVKHLTKLRIDPKYRVAQDSVVICSRKLIGEISKLTPPKLVIEKASESVFKKITGLATPEGIIAEFPMPVASNLAQLTPILVFDRVSDPGNMGTLIRTAHALGWGGVFFLPGCVDPFHEKVIRASRGALFYFPWRSGTWDELKALIAEDELTAIVAHMKGEPLDSLPAQKQLALIVSHEGEGISDEGQTLAKRVAIPMQERAESLNVAIAGALMMYHFYHA